jgi:hypothetical protein
MLTKELYNVILRLEPRTQGSSQKLIKEKNMIIYGTTMQGKYDAVPKEVAEWVQDRNARYPKIDFKIEYEEPRAEQMAEYGSIAKKYMRYYGFGKGLFGVTDVFFPYLTQYWIIRIIGGVDKDGNIIDRDSPAFDNTALQPLGPGLRAEIAGIASGSGLLDTLVAIGESAMGLPRNGEALADPLELVPLTPDFRKTSELTLSGEEFSKLMNDPDTGDEAQRAVWAKDWETLKRLKEKRN